jgi:hypothetical protein
VGTAIEHVELVHLIVRLDHRLEDERKLWVECRLRALQRGDEPKRDVFLEHGLEGDDRDLLGRARHRAIQRERGVTARAAREREALRPAQHDSAGVVLARLAVRVELDFVAQDVRLDHRVLHGINVPSLQNLLIVACFGGHSGSSDGCGIAPVVIDSSALGPCSLRPFGLARARDIRPQSIVLARSYERMWSQPMPTLRRAQHLL